ncbi:tRNA lysidine(34) synthetase TilS [bacterium]|nr:tRNA lysidine(34) synthetase TilS [bacterium]
MIKRYSIYLFIDSMQEEEKNLRTYKDFLQKVSDFSSFFEQERIQRVFQKFDQYLDSQIGLTIGVSGGVDSMSLICLLLVWFQQKQYPLERIHIVHCNHKIRLESETEAQYLKVFFHGLNFFYFERKEKKNLKEDENTLRKRRYECFYHVCKNEIAPILLTGHHLEDRIETSFLNSMRGASLKGFLNMKTFQFHGLLDTEPKFFRPLLEETKKDLYRFCQTFKIPFFEDYTNQQAEISQRNNLRLNIFPSLMKNQYGETHFLESMRNLYHEIESLKPEREFTFSPIYTLPTRNLKEAVKLHEDTKTFSKRDVLSLRERLGICYNITPGKIDDWFQRFQLQKGYKNLKDYHFFFHNNVLYLFQGTTKFREQKDDNILVEEIKNL